MRYQRLDLNLLTALRALLVEQNVTRAAASLYVSQSAMSGILARLREYFDDPLIVPVGRRMELTPLGKSLIAKVTDLLLRIDATLGTKPDFTPETSSRNFIVVATDYALSVLFLDVLRDLHASAGGVTLQFKQPTRLSFQELEAGEVDFIVAPEWYANPGVCSCPLFVDTYSAVVDGRSSECGESIDLAQYVAARHVSFENKGPPMFEAWFDKRYPGQRRVEVQVASFNLLPRLVVGTGRLATMHSRLAAQACEQWPVRAVRLDFECPEFVEMLQWHSYRDHDPGIVWMRDRILGHARQMPALTGTQVVDQAGSQPAQSPR